MISLIGPLTKFIVITSTTGLSIFMYANVVEKVFQKDIPAINSVAKTTTPYKIEGLNNNITFKNDSEKYGFYGKPVTLRVPRLNFAISLNMAEKIDNEFLVETGVASIFITDKSQGGHFGNGIIFGLDGDKILNVAETVVENDKIIIETNKRWKYIFKVVKRIAIDENQKYVVASSPESKIVIVKKTSNGKLVIVEAIYMNLEDMNI